MPRSRRQPAPPPKGTRWTASQLVAFNLARARRKAEMTQQEAADAISRYTESEWTQATVATAEGSVSAIATAKNRWVCGNTMRWWLG